MAYSCFLIDSEFGPEMSFYRLFGISFVSACGWHPLDADINERPLLRIIKEENAQVLRGPIS